LRGSHEIVDHVFVLAGDNTTLGLGVRWNFSG
jgi:hypothetical protein